MELKKLGYKLEDDLPNPKANPVSPITPYCHTTYQQGICSHIYVCRWKWIADLRGIISEALKLNVVKVNLLVNVTQIK